MDNSLAVFKPNAEQLNTIKNTICAKATEYEFQMFVEVAKGTGLNPFLNEIWFIKVPIKKWNAKTQQKEETGDYKLTIFAGRDGFLKIANTHPEYDGMESGVVYNEQTGSPIRAWAKVYRKDRKFPATYEAPFKEYFKKGYTTWESNPSAMILKVAEAGALKRAFPISGLLTYEEIGAGDPREAERILKGENTPKQKQANEKASVELCEKAFYTVDKQIIKDTLAKHGVSALRELDAQIIKDLIDNNIVDADYEVIKDPEPDDPPVAPDQPKKKKGKKADVKYEYIPDYVRDKWKVEKTTDDGEDVVVEIYYVEKDLSDCTCPARKGKCKHIKFIEDLKTDEKRFAEYIKQYPDPRKEKVLTKEEKELNFNEKADLKKEYELVRSEVGMQKAVIEYFKRIHKLKPLEVFEIVRKRYGLTLAGDVKDRHWEQAYGSMFNITKSDIKKYIGK